MDSTNILVFLIIAISVYFIGLHLHIKIIRVSYKDKDITWKLDITNSALLIFFTMHAIFMHGFTYFVQDLHSYTGEWVCYMSKGIAFYGQLYIYGHSLIVSILKYVIIVCWEKTMDFGRDRITEIFFWVNFLHPLLLIVLWLIVRPDFFWAYDGMKQIDMCLGDPKNNWGPGSNQSFTKLHNLCDFTLSSSENVLGNVIYICKTMVCGINVGLYYLILWNFFEIITYCFIFRFMRR